MTPDGGHRPAAPTAVGGVFDGTDPCWLRPRAAGALRGARARLLAAGPVAATLQAELARATGPGPGQGSPVTEVVVARADLLRRESPDLADLGRRAEELDPEGFVLRAADGVVVVTSRTERGLLYGWFALLRALAGQAPGAGSGGAPELDLAEAPAVALRMLDHWDNPEPHPVMGSVERGYAGASLLWRDGRLHPDRQRIADYALLLASTGVNAVSVNNVNVGLAGARLLTDHLDDLAALADLLRAAGIVTYLSVGFSSPVRVGGLDTADPLSPEVATWWAQACDRVCAAVPDLGGFLVKADSEGQPGPHTYGRTQAEGANALAAALAPHGGRVLWRCFVYDHHQDWRDRTTDRARAAFDHFAPLDGAFADTVVLQVKAGPMDFQVREPVSPMLLGLERTRVALEVQVTQEYTGHQVDLCCLLPQWSGVLRADTTGDGGPELATRLDAVAGVSNAGDAPCWTGHPLAQANLYGFGRLAWDPQLAPSAVLAEWAALTFPDAAPEARTAVVELLARSWETYELYTAPLGVGFMVTPHTHYGPDVDGYEYSRWGTYHFADRDGVGVDRTTATGSGYTGQYPPALAELYSRRESCPDELLLFFHHVPYSHVLRSGSTVVQHVYDSRFEGVERVERSVAAWGSLRGRLGDDDDARWAGVAERLQRQLANAVEWRDQVSTYFLRASGVPDAAGRRIAP